MYALAVIGAVVVLAKDKPMIVVCVEAPTVTARASASETAADAFTATKGVLLELAAAVAIAAALWFAYSWAHARGAESVQVLWDAEKRDQAEQSAKVTADALATFVNELDISDAAKERLVSLSPGSYVGDSAQLVAEIDSSRE